MTREDRQALLSGGIAASGGIWADLGSGSRSFTAALAEALGPAAIIYSVDSDEHALRVQ
jgi:precorrin-6B methylase 2